MWVAVGGTPRSVVRAGALGLPMALAIIGGEPERFVPVRRAAPRAPPREAGHGRLPLSINSHGFIADDLAGGGPTSRSRAFKTTMDRIGRERGWPPMTRAQYDASTELRGANLVGSPQQVAEKILFQHELFGHERFLIQFTVGTLPHASVMRSIELLGTEVAPLVRDGLARTAA